MVVHGNASLQTSSVSMYYCPPTMPVNAGSCAKGRALRQIEVLLEQEKCCYSRLRGNPTPRRLHNNRQATAAISTFGGHLEAANRTTGSRQAASSGQTGYLITYCQGVRPNGVPPTDFLEQTMAGSLGVVWCPAQTNEKYNLGCDSVKENTCKVAKGSPSCGTRLRCKA